MKAMFWEGRVAMVVFVFSYQDPVAPDESKFSCKSGCKVHPKPSTASSWL